jgi:elongation factor Ts
MMATITTEQIKKLREATNAGIMDCRAALEQADGDYEAALTFLREKGLDMAAKRADREAKDGLIELYTHGGGRVGVMVEVNCETDFVARSDAFRNLAHEIALHIAAASPKWLREEDVPEAALEAEREAVRQRAVEEGKKPEFVEKMLSGRIDKFMDETVLLRQAYMRDDSKTINDLISETVGSLGENVVLRRFARWELGEDLEAQS